VGREPQQPLRALVGALEVGDWPAVLYPTGQVPAGSKRRVFWVVLFGLVARSMQLQASGDVHDAWDQLAQAAARLPGPLRRLHRGNDAPRAALTPEPAGQAVEMLLAWRVARVIWREQFELEDLRRRFAPGRMSPRDQLIDSCIEHFGRVDFCPFSGICSAPGQPAWVPPDRSRSSLCRRGTRLRHFAEPAARDLSQSVWQDLGGFPGLYAEAMRRLASCRHPEPWWGTEGTFAVPQRRGPLRAWEFARQREDDRNYGN